MPETPNALDRGFGLLRTRDDGAGRVTYTELFFDLVYVFAITQLSHLLLSHLSVHGAVQAAMVLLAAWWAWVYTAWATNWLNPNSRPVRMMLLLVMLLSLMMSASIPSAFGAHGLVFAATYVAIQVGRSSFVAWAVQSDRSLRRNFYRIVAWSAASGVFWLAGGLAEDSTREALWLVALAIDYAAPISGFFVPGLGRSATGDWTIAGGHLAERCQLFLILALGESILVTGATWGDLDWSATRIAALVVAFVGSVALWWLYFDRSAEDSGELIEHSGDPGRLGRSAYTYVHLLMVAGIIVSAVADERSIAHPTGETDRATLAVILGGPALFLIGHALFKRAVWGVVSYSRLVGLAVLAALVPLATLFSPLALATAATLVLIGVAVWDYLRNEQIAPELSDESLSLSPE